jgi:hypothetical protein
MRVFKLAFTENKIIYGNQDKVNTELKKKAEISVYRHNIDDIKLEALRLQNEHPDAKVMFVGV